MVSASPRLSRSWNLRPYQVGAVFYFVIWFNLDYLGIEYCSNSYIIRVVW